MGHLGFGFAGGCEAVAMPRRQQPDYSQGYALVPGLALGLIGPKAALRASPNMKRLLDGGA